MSLESFENSNFVIGIFLKIRSFINLPYGHARSHKKFGLDRLDWIQTNKQKDGQEKDNKRVE